MNMKATIASPTADPAPKAAPKARKRKARKAKTPKIRPGNVVQESGWTLKEERLLAKVARYVARNPELASAIEDAMASADEGETIQ